jgi:hypothetical protein
MADLPNSLEGLPDEFDSGPTTYELVVLDRTEPAPARRLPERAFRGSQ